MKKDEAIKEIGRLKNIIERYEVQDKDIRRNLTNLLEGYLNQGWNTYDKHADMSWYEICFHIGELRADADIQCMIQRELKLRSELDMLKREHSERPKTL